LKNVQDLRRVNKLINCLCCFPGQRFSGEETHMFSQLAILDFLKENQEVEEEDLVWVVDLTGSDIDFYPILKE